MEVYREEVIKCAILLSLFLLTGRDLDWASAVWDSDTQVKSSFTYLGLFVRCLCIQQGVGTFRYNFCNYVIALIQPQTML